MTVSSKWQTLQDRLAADIAAARTMTLKLCSSEHNKNGRIERVRQFCTYLRRELRWALNPSDLGSVCDHGIWYDAGIPDEFIPMLKIGDFDIGPDEFKSICKTAVADNCENEEINPLVWRPVLP